MSGIKTGKYAIENRLPYEKTRIEEVRVLIQQGVNPLNVTLSTNSGYTRLTINDVANYLEFYSVPFSGVVNSFTLEGDNNERRIAI